MTECTDRTPLHHCCCSFIPTKAWYVKKVQCAHLNILPYNVGIRETYAILPVSKFVISDDFATCQVYCSGCFGNPQCCHSNICMLSNLHPVMVCNAAILHLGIHSKYNGALWEGGKDAKHRIFILTKVNHLDIWNGCIVFSGTLLLSITSSDAGKLVKMPFYLTEMFLTKILIYSILFCFTHLLNSFWQSVTRFVNFQRKTEKHKFLAFPPLRIKELYYVFLLYPVTGFTQETIFSSFFLSFVCHCCLLMYVCLSFHLYVLHLSQNQAKLFIEQKKIPFPVDNHNTNEELGKLWCSKYKPYLCTWFFHVLPVIHHYLFCHCSYRLRSDRQRSLWWSHQALLTLITGVFATGEADIHSQYIFQYCGILLFCHPLHPFNLQLQLSFSMFKSRMLC